MIEPRNFPHRYNVERRGLYGRVIENDEAIKEENPAYDLHAPEHDVAYHGVHQSDHGHEHKPHSDSHTTTHHSQAEHDGDSKHQHRQHHTKHASTEHVDAIHHGHKAGMTHHAAHTNSLSHEHSGEEVGDATNESLLLEMAHSLDEAKDEWEKLKEEVLESDAHATHPREHHQHLGMHTKHLIRHLTHVRHLLSHIEMHHHDEHLKQHLPKRMEEHGAFLEEMAHFIGEHESLHGALAEFIHHLHHESHMSDHSSLGEITEESIEAMLEHRIETQEHSPEVLAAHGCHVAAHHRAEGHGQNAFQGRMQEDKARQKEKKDSVQGSGGAAGS